MGNELFSLIKSLKIENNVRVEGVISRKQLKFYYAAADIFVLPSYTEGLPTVLPEALYMGLPVVASNVGGIPEIINNGENGFLIDPGNSELLSEKLHMLISNEALRKQFSKNSRKIAETKYTYDKISEQYLNAYNELI